MLIQPSDQTLLDAVLSSDDAFEATLALWQNSIELDDVAGEACNWLPLLAERVAKLGIECRDRKRLKGILRFAWAQNQRAMVTRESLMRDLAEAQVDVVEGGGWLLGAHMSDYKAPCPIQRFALYLRQQDMQRVALLLESCGWRKLSTSVLAPFVQRYYQRDTVNGHYVDLLSVHAARPEHSIAMENAVAIETPEVLRHQVRQLSKVHLLFSLVGREWHAQAQSMLPCLLHLFCEASEDDKQAYVSIVQCSQCTLRTIENLERLNRLHYLASVDDILTRLKQITPDKRDYIEQTVRTYISGRACDAVALYSGECQQTHETPGPVGFMKFLYNKQRLRKSARHLLADTTSADNTSNE